MTHCPYEPPEKEMKELEELNVLVEYAEAAKKAVDIRNSLEDYPIYDDEDHSSRELDEMEKDIEAFVEQFIHTLELNFKIKISEEETEKVIAYMWEHKNPEHHGTETHFESLDEVEVLQLLGYNRCYYDQFL